VVPRFRFGSTVEEMAPRDFRFLNEEIGDEMAEAANMLSHSHQHLFPLHFENGSEDHDMIEEEQDLEEQEEEISFTKVESETKSKSETPRKRVSFDTLAIREYTVVEGDHPCCREYPALSLGWEVLHETCMIPLDLYEAMRSPDSRDDNVIRLPRRNRCQLRLTPAARRRWLGLTYNRPMPDDMDLDMGPFEMEEEPATIEVAV